MSDRWLLCRFGALVSLIVLLCLVPQASAAGSVNSINHVIVIYQENWGFDSLYGNFPGANGLANAGNAVKQVDKNGEAYATLPQPIDTTQKPPAPDTRFPANMPVAPFNTATYVPANQKTGDLVHRFYQEQLQIDGGKMDKFIAWSDAAGLVMSYYDLSVRVLGNGSSLQRWVQARESRRPLHLNCLERLWVETKHLKNGRSDLCCLDRRFDHILRD